MSLDKLNEQIRSIVETMDRYNDLLRTSEALTRYVLIDSLLRALGWNTEDPSLVFPEYTFSGGGKADYALLRDQSPLVIIEAKKLNSDLVKGTTQAINYCVQDGIKYFAVTDGNVWKVYETHRLAPIEEKLITSFRLRDSSVNACLKALVLWRQSVHLEIVNPGEIPIDLPMFASDSKPEQKSFPAHEPSVSSTQNWISLQEFSSQDVKCKPTHIQFPDKTTVGITYWRDLILKPAQWLVDRNLLTSSNCPIHMNGTSTRRYLLSEKAMHPSDTKFRNAKPVGPLFVEAHLSSAGCVDNACVLIQHAGRSTSEFRVAY